MKLTGSFKKVYLLVQWLHFKRGLEIFLKCISINKNFNYVALLRSNYSSVCIDVNSVFFILPNSDII